MNFEINKNYHGFKLISKKYIPEIASDSLLFLHEKSGASLLKLENSDDNKTFSVSFRTPPKDDTGVAHILEHSVLCGSRKFTSKDPFIELAKGSLNTFLNAMTFPDKTMYPVASRNKKDFFNLMDVYMDSVLYPNIYKYKEIFMQEGWHYELEDADSELNYKGVVYNEMKGAYSSPDTVLVHNINCCLFPKNTYGKESGGYPESIPNLSYENFLNFHKTYYHPSNSYIFLYGDGNTEEELKFLNENYLKEFDKLSIDSSIKMEKPLLSMAEDFKTYPIGKNEDDKNKAYLSLNYVIGDSMNAEISLGFEVLEYMLLETPAAPLKKALLAEDFCEDVYGMYDDNRLQPTFSIVAKNTDINCADKFKSIVKNTLLKLVDKGIDKELIESSLNIKEFYLRESDFEGYPKGLLYNIRIMDSWLYGGDPTMHLEYEGPLNEIKKKALSENYFEQMIKKYILESNHCAFVCISPEKGLEDKVCENTKKQLSEYKNSLSSQEIDNLVSETKKLQERQSSVDSDEDLRTIPLLSIDDVDKKASDIPTIENELDGVKILHHPMFTSHISYVNMYFDSTVIEQQFIPYLTILSVVLSNISTDKYSYDKLSNAINMSTGGFRFSAEVYSDKDTDEIYYPKFSARSKSLTTKLPELFSLLSEILNNTIFKDTKRLKEIIQETKARMEMKIYEKGHLVSSLRALSYFSPSSKYSEILSGLTFYDFITNLNKNFDTEKDTLIYNLGYLCKKLFNKNNLIVGITCNDEDYVIFEKELNTFLKSINSEKFNQNKYDFNLLKDNEGLITSSKIQYVTSAGNFKKAGFNYSGSMMVLKTILSLDYLWNNVRVLGGAYGCFAGFQRTGNMYFTSYRDPNLSKTLDVYKNVSRYLENFCIDNREMTKYILGTISELDFPLTPSMKGDRADTFYIKHVTYEDVQKERDEVLATNCDTIKGYSKVIEEALKDGCICVLGGEEKISEEKNAFKNLKQVFV